MTAVRDVQSETEAGAVMVILSAMMGLKRLSDGDQPDEKHRNAWAELADHLELAASQPMPALLREAIVDWHQRRQVPWRMTQFAYRLGATKPEGIAEGIAELRILASGGAIASDRARALYGIWHHIVCSEVEKTWY
jgi:hypothetical protein